MSNTRVSLLDFFKTIFTSDQHQLHEAQMHPLFRESEKGILKKLRKQLKLLDLSIRNFENTYIAMIKELQEKTFKKNIECNQERSIIMRKREVAMNHNRMFATKFLENQMFDNEGNVLVTHESFKNSFNQSHVINN